IRRESCVLRSWIVEGAESVVTCFLRRGALAARRGKGSRRRAPPREAVQGSWGSHAPHVRPPGRALQDSRPGEGTTRILLLDVGRPCSQYGAQAMPQETHSRAQLTFYAAQRLPQLFRHLCFRITLKNYQIQRLALWRRQLLHKFLQQLTTAVKRLDFFGARQPGWTRLETIGISDC